MTSAQLILVSVTSAMVAVFTMLVVATILRARNKEDSEDETAPREAAERNSAPERNSGGPEKS